MLREWKYHGIGLWISGVDGTVVLSLFLSRYSNMRKKIKSQIKLDT